MLQSARICCIREIALQAGHALRRIAIVRHSGGNTRNSRAIRVEDQVQPAGCGVIQPDLRGAIDPQQRRLPEFGVEHGRRCAQKILRAERLGRGSLRGRYRRDRRWRLRAAAKHGRKRSRSA